MPKRQIIGTLANNVDQERLHTTGCLIGLQGNLTDNIKQFLELKKMNKTHPECQSAN